MKLKEILDHKRTDTIVRIVNVLVTIASICVAIYLKSLPTTAGTAGSKADTNTHWTRTDTYWMIIIGAIIVSNGGNLIFSLVRRNKIKGQVTEELASLRESYQVIGKLSALQESYILSPHYITATEHANHSKESTLSKSGTAEILTNSLKYDMFYSGEIAKNIVNGAKYIYILPYTRSIIVDLQNYIATIRESIRAALQLQGVKEPLGKVDELCLTNLEFFFFNDKNPCLYNFAIFRQRADGGSQPFVQYWWYINPSDKSADSHMLSYEIEPMRDQGDLDEVFGILKKSASRKSGQDVNNHRDNPSDWIGGKQ